jgi:hypothetical protein
MAKNNKTTIYINGDARGLDKAAKSAQSTLRDLKKGIMQGLGIGAGLGVANVVADLTRQVSQAVVELPKMAVQSQRLSASFGDLATAAGQSGATILSAMQEATGGTVADYDLMLSANKAMKLGVADSAEELGKLGEVARFMGRQMGISTTQAVSDLTTGIGRMSPLILDNLGITIAAETTYGNYAAAIGKSADELTDAEKKQALLNRVLEDGERQIDAAGGMADDAADSYEKFNAKVTNLKTGLGALLVGPASLVVNLALSGVEAAQATIDGFKAQSPIDIEFQLTPAEQAAWDRGPSPAAGSDAALARQMADTWSETTDIVDQYAASIDYLAEQTTQYNAAIDATRIEMQAERAAIDAANAAWARSETARQAAYLDSVALTEQLRAEAWARKTAGYMTSQQAETYQAAADDAHDLARANASLARAEVEVGDEATRAGQAIVQAMRGSDSALANTTMRVEDMASALADLQAHVRTAAHQMEGLSNKDDYSTAAQFGAQATADLNMYVMEQTAESIEKSLKEAGKDAADDLAGKYKGANTITAADWKEKMGLGPTGGGPSYDEDFMRTHGIDLPQAWDEDMRRLRDVMEKGKEGSPWAEQFKPQIDPAVWDEGGEALKAALMEIEREFYLHPQIGALSEEAIQGWITTATEQMTAGFEDQNFAAQMWERGMQDPKFAEAVQKSGTTISEELTNGIALAPEQPIVGMVANADEGGEVTVAAQGLGSTVAKGVQTGLSMAPGGKPMAPLLTDLDLATAKIKTFKDEYWDKLSDKNLTLTITQKSGGGGGGGGGGSSTLPDKPSGPGEGVLGMAHGGEVPGPWGQPVRAVVHGGEWVLNRAQQKMLGDAVSITINAGAFLGREADAQRLAEEILPYLDRARRGYGGAYA